MSDLPRIEYDPEIEIDGYIELRVGLIKVWFACVSNEGDRLIAFQTNERMGKTCLNPTDDTPKDIAKLMLEFRGRRCARCLDDAAFKAAWEAETDKYLYPETVIKIKDEIDLKHDTPLDILADWLQDKGHDTAARVLRASLIQANENAETQ